MSTAPVSSDGAAGGGLAGSGFRLALAALAAVFGLLAFSPQWLEFLLKIPGDGLRSVGLFVPPLTLWLSLRAWKRSDWQSGGSWWGLLPVVAAFVAAALDSETHLRWSVFNLAAAKWFPFGVLLWVYLVGVVLLFGGMRPLRRALFPLSLILLLNPCPQFIQQLIDLPLQNAGATVARGFARLLGVPLDGDLLHLMFTPEHGVFIAPGCDGLRGALTLGLATLVAGHLYRLRSWIHAGYVAAAVLTAYLLNFLRLCIVVLYTAFTVHVVPSWSGHGEAFDYLEGGLLFLLAAAVFLRWPARHPRLCTPRS